MQTSNAFCQVGREEPDIFRWKMVGKTKEISAHTVLPTREVNTPNAGTYEATRANSITTTARITYIPSFPALVK